MIPTALSPGATPLGFVPTTSKLRRRSFRVSATEAFPSFIPKQVEKINDPFARKLAARIERLPVQVIVPQEPELDTDKGLQHETQNAYEV